MSLHGGDKPTGELAQGIEEHFGAFDRFRDHSDANASACRLGLVGADRGYENDKATFVQQWWNVVNWADVEDRFEKARSQTPGLTCDRR
jgi:Fe-Mn family superoxide dismutase